ncbi:MAG TPA: DUF4157 domain-containing protein [Ktedonobacterales bacterium]|nr:DUF4157 domain-containing protein [Ktedonobacterales bacterium]
MSTRAYARRRGQRQPATADESDRLLLQATGDSSAQTPVAPASPTRETDERLTHDFGQIAVQPTTAPLAPQMRRRVSQPGEPHEQEADRIADTVTQTPDTAVTEGATPTTTHESGGGSGAGSGGQALDATTRAYMEPRFGHDFSQVRVHTDEQATQAAADYQARAYTVGGDIVFGAGEYSPETASGRHLLAHELTHVIQQQSDSLSGESSGVVQRQPSSPAASSSSADPGAPASSTYEETALPPSFRVHIIAHASPRWRAAQNAADADRRNLDLSKERAEAVRGAVETLLARYYPAGVSVDVDVVVDEEEGTVGVMTEARGSKDTLKEAGGNRSDNAQQRRRVDVIVDTSKVIEGGAMASRPPLKTPTASKFWHVSVDMTAGGAFGLAGSLIVLTLTNDRSGQTMTGKVWAGGGGPKASIGTGASVWSDPSGFYTDDEVDFQDFEGVWVRYTTIGASLFIGYSASYISFMGGFGSGAHSIYVGGASVGTVGVGGSVVAGPLSLDTPYPPTMLPIKGTDTTAIPYERDERGEYKHTVYFATGSANLGDYTVESDKMDDPEVALLDSFLASVVASTR